MSTVTLTFKLPEEKSEADLAQKAGDWYLAVYDTASELRRRMKYSDNPSPELEDFSKWFWGMLEDRGIDPYEA